MRSVRAFGYDGKMAPKTDTARSQPSGGGSIRPAANGDGAGGAAFEEAILTHLDAAYTLARYLTRRPDVAEDLVQDALLRAFRSFSDFRGANSRAWLLAIVRNCFLTWKAGRGEHLEQSSGEAEDGSRSAFEDGAEHATPETIFLRQEQDSAIRAAIERLPQVFREVLVLKDIEDMSYREIADVIAVPIGTVMSRLSRARSLFAEEWKKTGTSREAKP
jgi:RNA polymerase sigma factor (sigma-70 family)